MKLRVVNDREPKDREVCFRLVETGAGVELRATQEDGGRDWVLAQVFIDDSGKAVLCRVNGVKDDRIGTDADGRILDITEGGA